MIIDGDNMEKIFCTVKEFIPTNLEVMIGSIGSLVGICITHLFGGWSIGLEVLLLAMIIDYVSGVTASFLNPDLLLDSRVGFKGIVKKAMILLIVATGHLIDAAVGMALVMPMILYFYLANECLSITENAAKAGLPVPEKLKSTLSQLKDKNGKKE